MSILSRTLQTLLYKYLLDVDVEGVALPSLYENGWGVRLSNVKLREGIKLMDLPGTFPKKSDGKRKRSQKRSSNDPEKNSANNTESETNDHKNSFHASQTGISDVNVDPEDQIPAVETSSSWFSRLYCRSTPQAVTVPLIPEPIKPTPDHAHQPDDLVDVAEALPNGEESSENTEASDHEAKSDPSPPVILRLGKDGHIGVLDVRLVGKSIRVLVEDASLTVEVIQARVDDEEDATETSKAEVRKTLKDTKPPSTVGERVLAENSLARIFSAIPNLFLRDIRLRVIIRANATVSSSSPQSEEVSEEIEQDDTVLDFAIELLSVTDGEDFLSNFRAAADVESVSDYDENEDHTESVTEEASDFFKSNPSRDNFNEFDVKRIRTGRGEEGGVTIRVYSGSDMGNFDRRYTAPVWARQQFLSSSNYYALRLSGVDIESRVFLGENSDLVASGDVYVDDFRMDSMLFNIDFIAPASKKPLPPINSKHEYLEKDDQSWSLPGATTFAADMNGIQRCGLKSNFHRVSRGMVPVPCDGNHLPCEYCSKCWVECQSNPINKHFLDNSLPMGGFVMHASIRDILEINVDRRLLETIAILVKVFKRRTSPADVELETAESQAGDKTDTSDISESWDVDNSKSQLFSTSFHDDRARSRTSTQRGTKDKSNGTRNDEDASKSSVRTVNENLNSSFPPYMQPEKIQILGLHIGEVKFRVHILRNDSPDRNFTFCYWDLNSKCLTADVQRLTASECPFQDTRIDIGQLMVVEHIGIQTKILASLGTRHPEVDLDEMTVQTLLSKETDNLRPPWPSTAAILLDLPPPLETILYEARERHGLQLRLLKVDTSPQSSSRIPTSLNVALGSTSVDVPFGVQSTVSSVINIAKNIVMGTPIEVDGKDENPLASCSTSSEGRDSVILYKLRASGGRVKMHPRFDVSLPLSTAFGEWSSLSGICLETVLNGARIKYSNPTSSRRNERFLSLQNLAELPEHVRLRILLFLPDLKTMEKALGMKAAPNSFMRCRAVNKGLVKVARRMMTNTLTEHEDDEPSKTVSRRQELMEEFMKLGESELEDLFRIYNRRLKQSSRNPTSRR
ncbi:hypothetical protein FisN_2Lh358 [Fistulifera solaris]|uniref:Uncharacterized protein n=1 Tax=Fistulifera solaris TaxID=1519565 RepID=A0A1Z5J860_FISSO|nr:hypothetical protein FisN_2Lh358 [Fistulifera solaris]|eukprot:GAX10092.1 hypothetical protein FisN_2Lh358 [Fistulifera solaris]